MFEDLSPAQILVGGFLLLIIIGSLLLVSPWAVKNGDCNYLTALFTATSAVCVTGLVLQDTGTYWSTFGQVVIMLLIQFGGLGLMSFATFYALLFGKKINLHQRLIMQQALNKSTIGGIVNIFRHLLIFTFTIELFAAVLLAIHWTAQFGFLKAVWMGLFHSISAFNNAGFDLFGHFTSLTRFSGDIITNLIIAGLFIFGGLGFIVLDELITFRKNKSFSLHTKIVLLTTAVLIFIPFAIFFITEYSHALQGMPFTTKLTASFFQVVSPRTAGFNTIDLGSLFLASQFLIIILMFIGGSPGSTAGGVKTSTISVVCITIINHIRGKKDTQIFNRRLESEDILRAMTILALSGFFIAVVIFLMSIFQKADFIQIVFEVVSAFGTVGLSLGLTGDLTTAGKILIMLTMFAGRVGPLTLALALAHKEKHPHFRYPEEKVMLG